MVKERVHGDVKQPEPPPHHPYDKESAKIRSGNTIWSRKNQPKKNPKRTGAEQYKSLEKATNSTVGGPKFRLAVWGEKKRAS